MTVNRTFLDSMRAFGLIPDTPTVVVTRPTTVVLDGADTDRYLTKALATEADTVAATPAGSRSHVLNRAAYNLGQLVAGAGLNEQTVVDALYDASLTNGHVQADGERSIRNTITSGLTAGQAEPRGVPALRPVDHTIAPFEIDENSLATYIDEHLPRLDWHALWADDSEEEWIVEPILPARRLIALYSAPKLGKSLLMLEIAVAVATGRPVLGVTPDRPRRVLYVDFENDPKADIRERLQAMRIHPDDLDNLVYLSFPSLAALDSDTGGKQLLAAIAHYTCEVVVIDTVSRAIAGEENENDTWLGFYRHTGLRLKQAGIALVRLDHSGKDETKGQRGGSAKSGDVDAVWRLSRITDDSYRLDCEAARMQVTEKTLVLHRLDGPLRHRVDAMGRAAATQLKVDALRRALDEADAPVDISNKDAHELIRSRGQKARNEHINEAVKMRRLSIPDGRGFDLETRRSPTDGDRWGSDN